MYLTLLMRFWFLIPIAILTATTAYYKHEATYNHDQLITYKATVDALGQAQAQASRQKDAEHAKTIANAVTDRDLAIKRLRESETSRRASYLSVVPDAPASGGGLCFDPSAITAAVERYRQRVAGVVAEGDAAQIDARALLQAWPR